MNVTDDCPIHDYAFFDSKIVARLRIILKGEACTKTISDDGSIIHRAASAEQVLKMCKIPQAAVELTVQRLRWLQRLLKTPEQHDPILTALFSPVLRFESTGYSLSTPKLMNPWVAQVLNDLQIVGVTDEGAMVLDAVRADVGKLLFDSDTRLLFCELDLERFRCSFFCSALSPAIFDANLKEEEIR